MKKYNSRKMLVEDVFVGGKYRIFREFCKEKQIFYIGSIKEKTIGEFSEVRGVGKVRLKQVLDKLETLGIILDLENSKILFNIDKLKVKERDNLKSLKISDEFSESKFRILRKYCEDRKIVTLFDMTNKDINDFKEEKGIGKKRYKDFIENLIKVTESKNIKKVDEIAKIALDNLNSEESLTIIARLIEELSLQETAEVLEVNFEKAKQIENKALNSIQSTLDKYNALKSLKLMAKSFKKFSLENLERANSDEKILITNLIKKEEFKGISYVESTNTAYFNIVNEETA
ncbi:MAG TPA: sigma factor-like helix-turn-helix DNA-binding protein [Tissierellaceae bacterium]|nr:sigma factor-like helix-turn-helix DNA-binding protein [Tissierellaceae bacterium]